MPVWLDCEEYQETRGITETWGVALFKKLKDKQRFTKKTLVF